MKAKKGLKHIVLILGMSLLITPSYAILKEKEKYEMSSVETPTKTQWPKRWLPLKKVVLSRVNQSNPKMKLTVKEMYVFEQFLNQLNKQSTVELLKLQEKMPKTTIELLSSVENRGVALEEAEKMAAYLISIYTKFDFQNPGPFDENTSHIIGREWHEIDYSGENMTWKKQRQKYSTYGIQNFKSVKMLENFFPVEATLPYFKKIYHPRHPNALSREQ